MNCNKKHYNLCIYCNNDNGAQGYHWEVGYKDWKEKQGNKKSVYFSDTETNALIYYYYLMATSEKYVKE